MSVVPGPAQLPPSPVRLLALPAASVTHRRWINGTRPGLCDRAVHCELSAVDCQSGQSCSLASGLSWTTLWLLSLIGSGRSGCPARQPLRDRWSARTGQASRGRRAHLVVRAAHRDALRGQHAGVGVDGHQLVGSAEKNSRPSSPGCRRAASPAGKPSPGPPLAPVAARPRVAGEVDRGRREHAQLRRCVPVVGSSFRAAGGAVVGAAAQAGGEVVAREVAATQGGAATGGAAVQAPRL
jgi:hypothetical protein